MCVSAQTYFEITRQTDDWLTSERRRVNQLSIQKYNANLESISTMSTISVNTQTAAAPTRQLFRQTRTAGQPTILVVEDHDDTREMLHVFLEMWGYRVVEACNGLEAVEAASRERPQLILMDSRLPLLDGLGATRRIRESGLLDQVKIVALNGSGSPRYHADALEAGCDDCIDKPFDFEELRTYLSSCTIVPYAMGQGN